MYTADLQRWTVAILHTLTLTEAKRNLWAMKLDFNLVVRNEIFKNDPQFLVLHFLVYHLKTL